MLTPLASPNSIGFGLATRGAVASAAQTYQEMMGSLNPIAYWQLAESSGIVATDSSAGGNDGEYLPNALSIWLGGTLGQTGPLTGNSATSALLNGTTGYVDFGTDAVFDFTFNTPFSLLAWAKTSDSTHHCCVISKYSDSGVAHPGWFMSVLNSQLLVQLQSDGGTYLYKIGSPTVSDDVFHLLALTYDGSGALSGLKLYIDGAAPSLADSGSAGTLGSLVNNVSVKAGSRPSEGFFFPGLLAQAGIFDYALSAAQLLALYDKGING